MILTEWRRSRSGAETTAARDTVLTSTTGKPPENGAAADPDRLYAAYPSAGLNGSWPNPWKRCALDFDEAVTSHRAWRQRIAGWLGGDTSDPLDHHAVGRDDQCLLGQWLAGEGRDLHEDSPRFQQLKLAHTHFHLAAAAVLRHQQEGRALQAREALRTGSFPALSARLQSLILGFRIDTDLARFRTHRAAQPARPLPPAGHRGAAG
jgi:Chemoreceptor zinc-binding domain